MIGLLDEVEEVEQGIAKHIGGQSARRLDVNHRHKVLLARQTLRHEVLQLLLLVGQRTVEVIAAHLQPILMGKLDVALEHGINAVATLGSLQIDVSHLGIVAHRLPEHLTLIVAQVDAMRMRTSILTLEIRVGTSNR